MVEFIDLDVLATAMAPSVEYESAFLAMLADFEANDPLSAEFYAPAKSNFAAYVDRLLHEEQGLHLSTHGVACTHRWLVAPNGALVAAARVRHHIDLPFLAENGGHIGYDVAPLHRGQGFGHLALRTALSEATRIGLRRVLLLAAESNIASRSIIERQGAELEATVFSHFWGTRLCRYWIALLDH